MDIQTNKLCRENVTICSMMPFLLILGPLLCLLHLPTYSTTNWLKYGLEAFFHLFKGRVYCWLVGPFLRPFIENAKPMQ